MGRTASGNRSVKVNTPQHDFDQRRAFRRRVHRWARGVAQPIGEQRNHVPRVITVVMRRYTPAANRTQ